MDKPVRSNILVELDEESKTFGGAILRPETTVKEGIITGIVLAVGPGKMLESGAIEYVPLKAGARIRFPKWVGNTIEDKRLGARRELRIIPWDEVLSIVEE